jgi:hypothetical protein
MAVLDVTIRVGIKPPVAVISTTILPVSGNAYVTQNGISGKFTWEGIEYTWVERKKYTFNAGKAPVVSDCSIGETFTIYNSTLKYRVDALQITLIEGADLFVNEIIDGIGATPPKELPEGHAWIKSIIAGGAFSLIKNVNGTRIEYPLIAGSTMVIDGRINFYNGVSIELVDRPYEVRACAIKNIDIQNFATATVAGTLPLIDRVFNDPIQFTANQLILTLALVAQIDERENGIYRLSIRVGQVPQIVRVSQYSSGRQFREGVETFFVALGDIWGGRIFAFVKKTHVPGNIVMTIGTDPIVPIVMVPNQADLMAATRTLQDAIALKADNADLTAAVTQIESAFNDLDLTKADKADLTAANKAISDLTAALASNTATDAEINAAMTAANDAIAALQVKTDGLKPEVTEVLARSVADLSGRVTAAETAITEIRTIASSAIAEWSPDIPYKTGNKVLWKDAFFKALKDNLKIDPSTDKASNWVQFIPGQVNDIFANRSPIATDNQPAGIRWHDTSFGPNTLDFVSLGGGVWQFLNAITLTKIRFHVSGYGTTFRSKVTNLAFLKPDGTAIPNGHFVWGASSGVTVPLAGTAYALQQINCSGNRSGWADIEPNASFDTTVSISKITGGGEYSSLVKIEFHFSNGGIKTYTGGANPNYGTMDPPQPARYGDSVAALQGEVLTAIKLADPANLDPGRITGKAFNQAWLATYRQYSQLITQHDFGVTTPEPLFAPFAHLEGGAGYTMDAADFTSDFTSLITNTTDAAISGLTFTGFDGVFLVDGGDRTDFVGPLTVPANKWTQVTVTVTVNGPTKWVNLYPSPVQQIGVGSALPLDSSVYKLFLLEGHATLPNGLWRWDGVWIHG